MLFLEKTCVCLTEKKKSRVGHIPLWWKGLSMVQSQCSPLLKNLLRTAPTTNTEQVLNCSWPFFSWELWHDFMPNVSSAAMDSFLSWNYPRPSFSYSISFLHSLRTGVILEVFPEYLLVDDIFRSETVENLGNVLGKLSSWHLEKIYICVFLVCYGVRSNQNETKLQWKIANRDQFAIIHINIKWQ